MKIKYCKHCRRKIVGTKYTGGINFIYHDWCYRKKWGYHYE